MNKICHRCRLIKPLSEYSANVAAPDGHSSYCRDCRRAMRAARAKRPGRVTLQEIRAAAERDAARGPSPLESDGPIPEPKPFVPRKRYVPSADLNRVWQAALARTARGQHAPQLMFLGPSGCGKTEAAKHLAASAGLPFTKVDVAAMTDPESWFGTREVEAQDGVSVTTYRPSVFVTALTQPGVILLDEINRIKDPDRNIVLPIFDDTHSVTNPLTGETIVKDPGCIVIMSGNRGLQFTGIYPVDPALMTRASIVIFDYLDPKDEIAVAAERTGVSPDVAGLFVRFASETRRQTKVNPDLSPISTREVIEACQYVADGLTVDLAADVTMINGASSEGAGASVQAKMREIWIGVRPTYAGR